jgi:outer membrane protein insertion porin family
MIRATALLLLVCPMWAWAQNRPVRKSPAAPAGSTVSVAFPIESVAIEGNREYTREQILGVAGLAVGLKVVAKDFEAARERLVASGAFANVGYRFAPTAGGTGYALTLEVAELEPMFPVRFEDLGVPDSALEAVLKRADPFFGLKVAASEALLKRDAAAIEQYLTAQNRGQAVAGRLAPDDSGRMAVVFRPAAQAPVVARVRFTGNKVVPSSALENTINAVAVGIPYSDARLRTVLDANIRPLYEARGRVRVSFPRIEAEKDAGVNGLAVIVAVEEGESYSLADVKVEGGEVPAEELVKTAALKTGDTFNIREIEAAVARVEKRIRREGFLHVKTEIRRQVNDAEKKVAVLLHLDPGPRYVLGKVEFQGLDIISEPALRKIWMLQPGQPFNADYPEYFLSRVRSEGMFDNLGETKAVVEPDDAARTVNVTLLFKGEAPKPKKKPWE